MSIHIYKKEKDKEKLFTQKLIEIKKEEQQKLNKKIIEVEEAEKKRIAQNIHDEIGSIFVALKYQIGTIENRLKNILYNDELKGLKILAEQGIKKQYDIIDDLLFEMPSEKSVKNVLIQHIDLIKLNDNLKIHFTYDVDESLWNDFQKNQLVKIVKELMTNTIKHANASNISLSISGKSALILKYSDNGIGFDPTKHYHGNGLKSIHQRINALNGTLEIESTRQGSHFNTFIPLSNA
jgi:signal transduction histidine kinase